MITVYVKAVGCVLIAVIFCAILTKHEKHISLLLSISVCCIVSLVAVKNLTSLIDFFYTLQKTSNLDPNLMGIILKAVGIGLLAEISCLICADSGNAAMGKTLQFLATAVILCISIPLLNELMKLVESILGKV